MADTRALFTSIGASALLVAAAALSLLTMSAVFAFGGWSDSPAVALQEQELILSPRAQQADDDSGAAIQTASAEPIVLAQAPPQTRRSSAGSVGSGPTRARPAREAATRKPAPSTSTPGLNPPVAPPVTTTRPPAVTAAAPPSVGNNVRKVGEDLSSTVQDTGAALAQVTAPLAPPISTAVQEVFNAVAALLAQTTKGLGGAIDALLPPKR